MKDIKGIYESKKTKLPLKDILKLSILPLKNKKARLFLTSLLIAFTTMFLSIFYCIISYNPNGKHLSLINDKNETFLEINKYQKIDKFTSKTVPLSNEEINKIKSSLNIKSYPSYIVNNYSRYIKFWGLNIYEPEDMFNDAPAIEEDMYTTSIGTLQIINDEYLKDNKLDLIGNYTKNKNEIIISNYLADLIITYGIYEYKTENLYQPSNYEQIVNDKKKIKFGENYVIISGIVNYDLKKYQVLKNKYASKNNDSAIAKLHNEHALLNAYNIYNKVFTNSNFIEMLKETNPKDYIDFNGLLLGNINAKEIKELIKKYPLEEKYSLNTKYSDTIRNYNKHLNFFKPIVNVIILIFTIFSILLISNFTLNSIKTRKKSIGILRALGITQKDVFKIFIFEFIILSFISTIISGTLSYFLFILLRNTTFSIDYEILNPFHLNYQLILFIYLYTILVIIISSIIPLFKFITKPPIDVIKDKK